MSPEVMALWVIFSALAVVGAFGLGWIFGYCVKETHCMRMARLEREKRSRMSEWYDEKQ